MAVFALNFNFVRRSTGASALIVAAYNAGEKLEDQTGSTEKSNYCTKEGVLYREITLPPGSPEWAKDRGELWRRLERKDDASPWSNRSISAGNFIIALPHELTLEENIFLVREYAQKMFLAKGCVVDWAIHAHDPRGDERNIHLHLLTPMRKIEGESFGNKIRYSKKELSIQLHQWRKEWASHANKHLRQCGHDVQIDASSLRSQGLKRDPARRGSFPRPRVDSDTLVKLRTMKSPLPIAPLVRTVKKSVGTGGTKIQMVIKHSALSQVGREEDRLVHPKMPADRTGWPENAIVQWEVWGSKNPSAFFHIWRELASADFVPAG